MKNFILAAVAAIVVCAPASAKPQKDPLQNCDGKCRSEFIARNCSKVMDGTIIQHDAADLVRLEKMNDREFKQAAVNECQLPKSAYEKPHVTQASYRGPNVNVNFRPGNGYQQAPRPNFRNGHEGRQGNCPDGFTPNKEEGTCEKHVVLSGGHPKYDQPHAGCEPGKTKSVEVPLPNGGTRIVHMTCRSGSSMRR